MSLSRREFVAAAAAVSAAGISDVAQAAPAGVTGRAPIHFRLLKPSEYNEAGLLRTLNAPHKNKQVFQASEATALAPGIASLFIHMQNSLNAFEFSYSKDIGPLSVIGVVMAPAMVFALNDAMWKKYKLGSAFKLDATNTYYPASSNLDLSAAPEDPKGIYQDWSAQAVLKRGGTFYVCHNATTAVAAQIAQQSGLSIPSVLGDFEKNLLPGFSFVPAGVATVQLAVEHGWGLFQV